MRNHYINDFKLYEHVLYNDEEYIIKYISSSDVWGTDVTLTHVDYKRVVKKKLQKKQNIRVSIGCIEKIND